MIPGKWYVVDSFSTDETTRGAVAGPFNEKSEAESERKKLNIADDCYVAKFKGTKNNVQTTTTH